jgi:hypothetical protein
MLERHCHNKKSRKHGRYISQEQLLEIKSLLTKIKQEASEINRPYSALISTVIFPYVLWYLFMNGNSPFHFLYEDYYSSHYQQSHETSTSMVSDITTQIKVYDEAAEHVENALKLMKVLLQASYFKPFTIGETLECIDQNPSCPIPVYDINILKRFILTYINRYLGTVGYELLSTPDSVPETKSLQSLYNQMKTISSLNQEVIKPLTSAAAHELANAMVNINFNKTILLPKVALVMFGQWLLVDPVLNNFFPYGVFHSNVSNRLLKTPSIFMTYNEAENLKHSLMLKEQSIAPYARRNIIFSRVLTVILLFVFILMLQNPEVTLFTLCFLISAASSALTGTTYELQKWYSQYQLGRKIAMSEIVYQKILGDYLSNLIIHPGQSPLFECRFKPYQDLSIKDVYNTILSVMIKHNLNIQDNFHRRIYLGLSQSLSKKKIKIITDDLDLALARALKVKKLIAQIEQLRKQPCLEVYSLLSTEQQFLVVLKIELKIPLALTHQFKVAFSHLDLVKEIKTGNSSYLNFVGHEHSSKFDNLVQEISRLPAAVLEKDIIETETQNFRKSRASKRKTSQHGPKSSKGKVVTSGPLRIPTLKITWPSATYDSSHKKCTVHPVITNFCTNRYFSVFRLRKHDFPNDDAFDHFMKIITDCPRLVPEKGYQGLVAAGIRNMKDHRGLWFFPTLKAKSLSKEFGNIRVIARGEQAETGEELHIFEAVKLKAH